MCIRRYCITCRYSGEVTGLNLRLVAFKQRVTKLAWPIALVAPEAGKRLVIPIARITVGSPVVAGSTYGSYNYYWHVAYRA